MNFTTISNEALKRPLPAFDFGDNTWIAGGALRDSIIGKAPNDIDIFGTDAGALTEFVKRNLNGCKVLFRDERLTTYDLRGTKVQVIFHKTYLDWQACLQSFDFTICQFAYAGGEVLCNPEAILHTLTNKLVVATLNPEYVIDSLRRSFKYARLGYSLCGGGIKEFVRAIRDADPQQVENAFEWYPDGEPRVVRFD